MEDPLLASDHAKFDNLKDTLLERKQLSESWFLKLKFVKEDLLSPLLGTTVLLPFAVAFVGVIVSTLPCLAPYTPTLLSTVILSQGLGTLIFSKFSAFTTCTNIDLLSAAYLARFGLVLQEQYRFRHGDELCGEALLVAMLLAQAMFTVLVGAMLCLVALVDGMWYLRFLPYPVACGFVSGIGLLILDGGFELGVGTSMKELLSGVGSLPPCVFGRAAVIVTVAVWFLFLRKFISNAMRLPVGLLTVSLAVHGGAILFGISEEKLQEYGVFMQGLEAVPWTASYQVVFQSLNNVHFRAFFSEPCLTMTLSYALLHVLVDPFYAAGMTDIDKPEGRFDLTKEINMMGLMNVGLGAVFGVPSCHSFKVCIVMKDSGAKNRIWVVLLGITFMWLYFDANLRPMVGVIPKCAFGGLVTSLGWDFLSGSLLESKERVADIEWRAVIVTALVTYFNVLVGLVFGFLITMALFVVEYAGITGIVNQATIVDIRSLLKRPSVEVDVLDKHGGEVAIFWCTGYIFFGTATGIVEEIEAYLDEHPETRSLILDFEAVPAVDASGVHALTEFAARCGARKPIVQVCFCGLVRRLKTALQNVTVAKSVKGELNFLSSRLESALQSAEDDILTRPRGDWQQTVSVLSFTRANSRPQSVDEDLVTQNLFEMLSEVAWFAPQPAMESLAHSLTPKCRIVKYDSRTMTNVSQRSGLIYEEGTFASDLIYVIQGTVHLTRMLEAETTTHKLPRHHLNRQKGDTFVFEEPTEVRVEVGSSGAILGAIEFCASLLPGSTQPPRHATSAIASPKCEVLLVPFKALHADLSNNTAAGHPVMTWLSARAGAQVLELTRASSMRAYRPAVLDEPCFSQAVLPRDEELSSHAG